MKFKKKLKTLTKKAPLGPAPIEWREPFDEYKSPLRISFQDGDPARKDMLLVQVRKVDGNIDQYIVKETMARALTGTLSPEAISECRKFVECSDLSDAGIASSLKETAERMVEGKLYTENSPIIRTATDRPCTTTSLRIGYSLTFMLLRYLERNPGLRDILDQDADWRVNGYELFHVGIMDHCCDFVPGSIDLTPTQEEEWAGLLALPGEEREEQSKIAVINEYNWLLDFAINNPDPTSPPAFEPCLGHNLLYTTRWFVERFIKHNVPKGESGPSTVIRVSESGEVQTIMGDDAAVDHLIAMSPEYLEASREGRVVQGPEGLQ